MKVIKPTPSQAAVALQKYLKNQGLSVTLANAQEAFARASGYADWNTLASDMPVRPKEKSRSLIDESELIGPFTVFLNHGFYDEYAHLAQARSMAEVFIAQDDPSEPIDRATITNARGKVLETFLLSHTRYRVVEAGEETETYATLDEIYAYLEGWCNEGELPLRVVDYRLEDDLGIVGRMLGETPDLLFEAQPFVNPEWTIWDCQSRNWIRTGAANMPVGYAFLSGIRVWLEDRLPSMGINAFKLVPRKDLKEWKVVVEGSVSIDWVVKLNA